MKKRSFRTFGRISSKDIFNADEMELYFKTSPKKYTQENFNFKDDKCFWGKHSKERIIVLLCVGMTGDEKIKALVIGKSKNPRCFKGTKSLEVDNDFQ